MGTRWHFGVGAALVAVALIGSWAAPASGYVLGETTANWTMLDGSQTVSYQLYDYRGKLVVVNLYSTT
jgi:hypothetical protein